MRYILSKKIFEKLEGRGIYNIERRNRFNVEKNSHKGGWNIEYSSKHGKGRALVFDKTSTIKNIDLQDDEIYLFGIETTPSNSGVGRMFLKDIFDYFDINTIYLPSSKNHPVWNKIATITDIPVGFGGEDTVVFKIDRNQIFESQGWSPLLDLSENVDKELVSKIELLLPSKGKILEISCGNGSDAIDLTNKGYDVTATDNCQEYVDHVNKYINCIKHDTRNTFPFHSKSFDLVYSRLGLHYFNKEELSKIFSEISRLTKRYLVFTVKIEQDSLNTGKIILNKSDWEELISNKFNIISSEEKEGLLYDNQAKWLEIVASVI